MKAASADKPFRVFAEISSGQCNELLHATDDLVEACAFALTCFVCGPVVYDATEVLRVDDISTGFISYVWTVGGAEGREFRRQIEQDGMTCARQTGVWPVIIQAAGALCIIVWAGACGGGWVARWYEPEEVLTPTQVLARIGKTRVA